MKKIVLFAVLAVAFLSSCEKDEDPQIEYLMPAEVDYHTMPTHGFENGE